MSQPSTSYRLSDYTARQIQELAAQMGTTATTVVTIAIDRMYRDSQQTPVQAQQPQQTQRRRLRMYRDSQPAPVQAQQPQQETQP
jgi:antitoxin component of RelBE/YafQ-DinJ toxin-antitoxin module